MTKVLWPKRDLELIIFPLKLHLLPLITHLLSVIMQCRITDPFFRFFFRDAIFVSVEFNLTHKCTGSNV